MARMPTEEFKTWFRYVLDILVPRYRSEIADNRQIAPTLLIFGHKKGELEIVPVEMRDSRDKELLFYLMKELANSSHSVKGVMLVTEAWAATLDKGQKIPKGDLELVPGRKEILLFSAIKEDMQLTAEAPIDRKNGLSILGVIDYEKLIGAKGRMTLD